MEIFFGIIMIILGLIGYSYTMERNINRISNRTMDKMREDIIREVVEEIERRQQEQDEQKKE